MPLQNYYPLQIRNLQKQLPFQKGIKMIPSMKFYNFNYKHMAIRHHLTLQSEQVHHPDTNNSTSAQAKPAAPSSKTSSETSSTASSSSKPTSVSSNSKAETTSSTHPPPKNAEPSTNSKPNTSSQTTSTGKSQSSPSSQSTPSPHVPSSANSSSSANTPKAGAIAASSSNNSKNPPPSPSSTPDSHPSKLQEIFDQPFYSNGRILGIQTAFLIHLGIALLIITIVIIIIVVLYKRYQTRKDYNQSPQNFAHKPALGFNQEYYLSHNRIEACLTPQRITIVEQNPLNGKIYKVEFKGTEKSAVYFHRRQSTTTYFEIQVLSANGLIEIGFIPCQNFKKLKSGDENMGSAGVGVTNSGFVQAEGQNVYNYSWILAYGDVIGIGLTRESSKFSQRRAWISKNGVLLNKPPNDEMDKWLATIQISAQQKNEYNLGTDKKENEDQKEQQQDEKAQQQKAHRQKIEGLLKKQRISLKTFNKFQYYPVIVCHGNKDQNKSTVINVNVGGQIFRMYDAQFRSGLLKDKALFGDD